MKWLLIITLSVLLLTVPVAGIAGVILYFIYASLQKSSDPEIPKTSPIQPRDWSSLNSGDLADLVLLRLELQRLLELELIDTEKHAEINAICDALCKRYLADLSAVQDNALWQKRRAAAWDLLNNYTDTPLGQPPWRTESLYQSPDIITDSKPDFSAPIEYEIPVTASLPATDSNTVVLAEKKPAVFDIAEEGHSSVLPYEAVSPEINKPDPTFNQYAWKPHEPGRLERTLATLSGWHSMAVPFLMQNIGWFIGVFCFIAGSMFLVSYSTGYAKNLIAFFAFFIFTLALLFGGYQLRKKRPELVTSSYVIFILSILLIPLTTITATQLLMSSDALGLQILSGLLVLVELGVFYFVVTLVSGLMDRCLQQGLPKFFLSLTAMCVLQLLLTGLPFWPMLAVIHLLILAILSVGIYSYATQWLQSIFIDQRKIAYFAAGMLVYAALVSFVFITVGNKIALPSGYVGFFLMLLCGLLFFVDAQFKQWTQHYAYLSRFSFFVYGLSVLALCLVAQYQTASMLTLVLAIGLYAFIVWNYLTLTPLTILLACCFWLYGLLVLQHLPASAHFLASLPVLLALHQAAKWALAKRQSAYLALIVYRVLYSLLAILTIWSLGHSESGLLAMVTASTAGVLIYYALKSAPHAIFMPYSKIADTVSLNSYQNLLNSHWFYSIPALGAATVFYAPHTPYLNSAAQFSLGLLLLSVFWAYQGLAVFFKAHSTTAPEAIEQRFNSALLSWLVGLLPLWVMTDNMRIIVLILAGAIACWLSYQLLVRWLFYVVLSAWGVAFALIKITYFPTPSSGLAPLLLGIAIWFWFWTVERQEQSDLSVLRRELATQKTALLPSFRLLWQYPVPGFATLFRDVIKSPSEQLMLLLWLLGMTAVMSRLLADQYSYAWLAAIFLASVFSGLLIVRYLLIKLLPLPIALMLGALLVMLKFLGLSTSSLLLVSVMFALAIWQLIVYSLIQPTFIKLANVLNPPLVSERERIAQVTHNTAFFIVLSSVVFQLVDSGGTHNLTLLLTLLTSAWFFWLSDRAYTQLSVRYVMIAFSIVAAIELVSLTLRPFAWQTLGTDVYAGLLFALLSLAVGALSTRITSYAKPAAVTAILLVFISVGLQIVQVIQIAAMVISPLDYSVLFLAGPSLLLANAKLKQPSYNLSAFSILILALLWVENSVLHPGLPFSLWLSERTFADLWLVLALLSLAISLLSHRLEPTQKGIADYCPPLNAVATGCFSWALLGTLTLFFATAGHNNALPWLFACLLPALFSLSKNCFGAAQMRGLASACLPTLAVFSLLPNSLDGFSLQTATVMSGYGLWLCASFVIPRFNKHYAEWVIDPVFFPWLGLLLVALSGFFWQFFTTANSGIYCLELSGYCLLMLRNSRWTGFSWLAAVAFTAAGIGFGFDSVDLPINLLLLGNLQLLLVNFWIRKGEVLAKRWQWQSQVLALAFKSTAKFIFIACLLIAGFVLLGNYVDAGYPQNITLLYTPFIGILLCLSFLHVLWLRFSVASLHGFIYAVFLLLCSIYVTSFTTLFHPPLFLALWSMILLGTVYTCSRLRGFYQTEITTAVTNWLVGSLLLATITLCSYQATALPELLLSLGIIICLSTALGKWSSRSIWLVAACVEVLIFLHLWPFLLVDTQNFLALLPWDALQVIIFACLFIRLLSNTVYARYWIGFIVLSLIELSAHGILIRHSVMTGTPLHWLLAPWDAIAALSTGLIISAIGVRHVRHLPDSNWVYGIVMLVGMMGFYSRLLLLGAAPVSLWDTSLLIGLAYSLFFLQRLFPSKPLLNMALFMPVLAIFTVPLQLASPETSVALIMTGLLYLVISRYTQQKIPFYLAILAFNGGVYLWIPGMVASSQLIQIYVIPAALSVLMLLQLHHRELKPSVLMASRLGATSSIYACATVDVFLRAELSIFILAMGLSVVGILLGIALRTRAFLYTGVSFLLLNVIGQLLRFYPEQGLGKAIVLMVMGTVIISLMIWFNVQRVAILQRINAFQAEMQTWE